MISKHKLKHTAAGLVDKFVARDNDYGGLWALGLMYNEAGDADDQVALDLLRASAQPEAPACTQVARNYAEYLRRAMEKHGFGLDALEAASVALVFGLPPIPMPRGYGGIGKPFSCTIKLVTKDGRSVSRQRIGHCAPQSQFAGTRRWGY